jgi:glycolate oxidase FAD binding subunit
MSDLAQLLSWDLVDPAEKRIIQRAIASSSPPTDYFVPNSESELATLLQQAQTEQKSLLIMGSGSKLDWGSPVRSPQWVVTTKRLNRILDHAVGDLTVTVEAGVTLQQLQDYLLPHRQFLPLDPAYSSRATLGGIVATADAGSWRQRYGGVRDLLLGIQFVRADGAIAKAGGRVVKNVAGYDLMKLFAGSYGTLGIITGLTFRLYPLPEASQTLAIAGDIAAIADFNRHFRQTGLSPIAVEVLSPALSEAIQLSQTPIVLIRYLNLKETVTAQCQQTQSLARSLNLTCQSFTQNEEAALWQKWRDRLTDGKIEGETLAKIGLLPQGIPNFLEQLTQLSNGIASINLGAGVGKLRIKENREVIFKLRSLAQEKGGYLTLLEASPQIKQEIEPWGYVGNSLSLMAQIRQKFDPQSILNPHRMG